jgi:hypothetical protein
LDSRSLVLSNPTASDTTTIPFFDETQQNSIERRSQRTRKFSFVSAKDKHDNESIVTVNTKIFLVFLFLIHHL